MATSITTTPTYAVPNRPATVVFTPGDGATNFLRVWATTAPEGTEIRKRIDSNKLNRSLVYQGPGGVSYPWKTTFEKGGAYELTLQEYTRGNAWGGGYEGDPRGAPSETKNGGEQTATLYVAQQMTQRLGVGSDTADLVLFVVNNTVRPTTVAAHGIETPTVTNPSSDKAATAAKEADLLTAVLALSNDTITGIGGTLDTNIVRSLVVEFVDHAGNTGGTWHQAADTANAGIEPDFLVPSGSTDLAAMATAVNKVRAVMALHMNNATEASPTPGSVVHHDHNSQKLDLSNQLLPITADAGDPATVFQAIGDYVRAYERHRIAVMHDNADTTNTVTLSARALLLVHQRFFEALTEVISTPPNGQTAGAMTLITHAGFQEN